MTYCELCRKDGHIVFECHSDRARTIDEAVNSWFSYIVNQYQCNSVQNVNKELFIEADHMRRLSKGDLLYLLRGFIYHRNWGGFANMYCRDQYMYFYLGYKIKEFIGSSLYNELNEASKLRIKADSKYWFNRAHLGKEVANELWLIDLDEQNAPPVDCAVCLRDNLEHGEMAVFSCGHNFCAGCSHTMIMNIRPLVCPLCRSTVNQIIQYQNDGNFSIQSI
jgi:hypothetical protein